ncbi:hypothetical protein [Virgibacillus doumboii]|uniref:hypothetical protein n=1 Tax=Virgibacillus doumboii TaxID=2697503 RepID=UPI0013E0243C|nr:hypothetical protein [Virgibacillus doumboii]
MWKVFYGYKTAILMIFDGVGIIFFKNNTVHNYNRNPDGKSGIKISTILWKNNRYLDYCVEIFRNSYTIGYLMK